MPATCVRCTRELILIRPLEEREKGKLDTVTDARAFARSAFVVPCKSSTLMPRDSFSIVVDAASRPRTYVYVSVGLSVCRSRMLARGR